MNDDKGLVLCHNCLKSSHMRRECRGEKVSHQELEAYSQKWLKNLKEIKQNGSKPIGYFDSPNISEEDEETYIKLGKIEDRQVRMKIDTGAKMTVVAKEYVPRHLFTGNSVLLRYIGGIEESLPEAEVVLNGDRKGHFSKSCCGGAHV